MKDDYHYGFGVLKIWMCLEVILTHFLSDDAIENGKILVKILAVARPWAVPVFAVISFILTGRYFFEKQYAKIRRRIRDFIRDQVVWTIVYFCIYAVLDFRWGTGLLDSGMDFVYQLFFGHSPFVNASMWYQTTMSVLMVFFYAVTFCIKDKKSWGKVLTILLFVCFVLQYSGINGRLFASLPYEMKYPLGRIVEMIPYACAGMLISYHGLLDRCRNRKMLSAAGSAGCLLISYALSKVPVLDIPGGYDCGGLCLLASAVSLIFFSDMVPWDRMDQSAKRAVFGICRLLKNVYITHRLAATLINFFVFQTAITGRADSLSQCLFIFFVSFLFCYIIEVFYKAVKEVERRWVERSERQADRQSGSSGMTFTKGS